MPAGAPTKCDEEHVSAICAELEKGTRITRAVELADVSFTAYWKWTEDISDPEKVKFVKRIKASERVGKEARRNEYLQSIADSGNDPARWTARAWLLEREFGNDYRTNDKQVQFTITPQELLAMSDEEFAAWEKRVGLTPAINS